MEGCVIMSNKNSFMKVELLQQYDVINRTFQEDRTVKIDISSIQKGIIKEIGATEFSVLMCIAAYTDNHGQAFPSQRLLSEITGLSLPTINKIVNKLLKIEINGVPILSREFEQTGNKKKFSVYTLNINKTRNEESELNVSMKEAGPEAVPPKTAKDFGHMFKYLYEEEFNIPYHINYSRDLGMIKSSLMKNFTDEQICKIIEYSIKHYKEKWSKDAFPYPTIAMLCSWLANAVMQILAAEEGKQQQQEELQKMAAEYINADYSNFDMI